MQITLEPIAIIHSPRKVAEDDNWAGVVSTIELDAAQFKHEALQGLDAFSHADVVFFFHQVPPEKVEFTARHPRNREDWPKVGIFAQRGRNRPNRLAVSTCRVLKVEGLTVTVEGLDAIEGTPVLDIKPHMKEFAPRGEIRQPVWSEELMRGYY